MRSFAETASPSAHAGLATPCRDSARRPQRRTRAESRRSRAGRALTDGTQSSGRGIAAHVADTEDAERQAAAARASPTVTSTRDARRSEAA